MDNTSKTTETQKKKKGISKKSLKRAMGIFSFIKPYRLYFILGMVLLVITTLASLAFPYLLGALLSVATGETNGFFSSINQVGLVLLALLFLQAVSSYLRIQLFAYTNEKAMAHIRSKLYEKIISLPISFFEKNRVGDLLSRLTADVTQLQDVLSVTLAEFFRQIVTLFLGIAILLVLAPKLTLLMLATFPVIVIIAVIFGRFTRKSSKKTQDELAQANVIVEETFQSIQVVKSFTNEHFETQRYDTSLQKVVKQALKVAKFRGALASLIIFGIFGSAVIVLWNGAFALSRGDIDAGQLFSFVIYTIFIGGAVGSLGNFYAQIQKAVGSSERILEMLEEQIEVEMDAQNFENQIQIAGKIQFEDVHFAYPTRTDIEVLKGISFDINSGEKVALVGYSGAGKSTIVQLINRFYEFNQGKIYIDDKKIQYYNITQLRQQIGIVPQEVILFGGTILENIAYGKPEATLAEVQEAAQKANALEFINEFPDKFDTVVGERGIKLSGGQRQRIAIARAILKNPSILILDEATSSLDADSEKLVQEALEELMKNRTTIMIAHRLATVRQADKIFVIDKGQIVEKGTHETLSEKEEGIYQKLVKLQFQETEVTV